MTPGDVLDATALLAYLQGEAGAELVEGLLEGGVISAANWSEVLQKVLAKGLDAEATAAELVGLGIRVEPVNAQDALVAARWWLRAGHLSLGDRLCLALASRLGHRVVTADRDWRDLPDIPVLLIRRPRPPPQPFTTCSTGAGSGEPTGSSQCTSAPVE